MKAERILTRQEFATLIGVSRVRVRDMIIEGKIKVVRTHPDLISPEENKDLVQMYSLKNKIKENE